LRPPLDNLAIVALTPRGLALGQRLAREWGQGEVLSVHGSFRQTLQDLFCAGRPLVCIMALGIVVRILGPVLADKASEPAVVVVDEAGHFAVSVLGGHAGGANVLAADVARALSAVAVITTASETLRLPAVDLIGQSRGWKIEERTHLKEAAAAVVRAEPVAVYQDAGSRDWWQEFGDWPAHFHRCETWPRGRWSAALVISDRLCPPLACPTITYRPPTLVLGVGCKRGVPAQEIEELFQSVCRSEGFALLSLAVVATVDLKADEPGLQEFAARHGVPLRSFGREELAAVGPLPTPSEAVRARIGVAGVSEPAAMLAAGTRQLLLPKVRGRRVTLAIARREEP
jgi:cobalt-precorrin 5A hydrolase